jgi:polyribonucleotide nucleotidyltransferase
MKKIEKTIDIGGRKLTISSGHIANQATGAVMASYGETVVIATVVAAPMKNDLGYFPLSVEYQVRLYAGGRIKGSRWVKREGRPSDDDILTARLIDRSIRPLFPKSYKKEVQVIITVLSVDLENTPDIPAALAVSAALASSSIPWMGPVGATKVGLADGRYIANPKEEELTSSEMDLVVSSTKDAVVMIEAGANEVEEKDVLGGVDFALKENKKIVKFVEDFAKEVGNKKEKLPVVKTSSSIEKKIKKLTKDEIPSLVERLAKNEASRADENELKSAVADNFDETDERREAIKVFEKLLQDEVRSRILSKKRPDGRKLDKIRKLDAQVGILPRTHGTGLFQRGQTQALTVATLGAPSLEQLIESAEGEESKRYIHHYSFPPYSVGETGRVGAPARREIGHGALAERALLPVIPSEEEFPYTIRMVSEILSSNGSTSMAATCGSTLALMDAGVPIKAPIAGIAMGLVVESKNKYVVLTDITGIEDGNGDMDFKVAGSEKGITSLQLDVKTLDLTHSILEDVLRQARQARLEILKAIKKAIAKPRSTVSKYAPKIKLIKIDIDKIGDVIGPGGRTVKKIIAETGAQIDIEDDGAVSITGMTDEEVKSAVSQIELLTREAKAGEIYEGEVKRIQSFGAFVEILPGKDGMVHVSDMSADFVKDPSDVVKIGDKVKVKVKEIDDLGRVNLTMLLDDQARARKARSQARREGGGRSGFNRRRPRTDYRNRPRPGGRRKSSGPHFPTSRLLGENKKNFSR